MFLSGSLFLGGGEHKNRCLSPVVVGKVHVVQQNRCRESLA